MRFQTSLSSPFLTCPRLAFLPALLLYSPYFLPALLLNGTWLKLFYLLITIISQAAKVQPQFQLWFVMLWIDKKN